MLDAEAGEVLISISCGKVVACAGEKPRVRAETIEVTASTLRIFFMVWSL